MQKTVSLTVNGKPVSATVEGRTLLVQLLREQLDASRPFRCLRAMVSFPNPEPALSCGRGNRPACSKPPLLLRDL
jgi:hypothetical protein